MSQLGKNIDEIELIAKSFGFLNLETISIIYNTSSNDRKSVFVQFLEAFVLKPRLEAIDHVVRRVPQIDASLPNSEYIAQLKINIRRRLTLTAYDGETNV